MAGTMKMFCIRKNTFSHGKKNLLFLPCNITAVQNLYCTKVVVGELFIMFNQSFFSVSLDMTRKNSLYHFRIVPKPCLHLKKWMERMSVSLACTYRNMVPNVPCPTHAVSTSLTWTVFTSFNLVSYVHLSTMRSSLVT